MRKSNQRAKKSGDPKRFPAKIEAKTDLEQFIIGGEQVESGNEKTRNFSVLFD